MKHKIVFYSDPRWQKLSSTAKAVLHALYDYSNYGRKPVSNFTISLHTGLSQPTINNAIRDLKDFGAELISRRPRYYALHVSTENPIDASTGFGKEKLVVRAFEAMFGHSLSTADQNALQWLTHQTMLTSEQLLFLIQYVTQGASRPNTVEIFMHRLAVGEYDSVTGGVR